ncbi:MAG: hypothetical protein KKD99_08450, partial [Proteobacteria bacterium]|nr:hypothetical protein [Pseudomonadota bacterium]
MADLEGMGIKPLQVLTQPLGQDRVFQRLARLFGHRAATRSQLGEEHKKKKGPDHGAANPSGIGGGSGLLV